MKYIAVPAVLLLAAFVFAGDDANPYELATIAGKQAWISYQRDLDKIDQQYQRDRKARTGKAIIDLERAKVQAAQSANADEIVKLDKAIDNLRDDNSPKRSIGSDELSADVAGKWSFVWGTSGSKVSIEIMKTGRFLINGEVSDTRQLTRQDSRILWINDGAVRGTSLELIPSHDRLIVLGWNNPSHVLAGKSPNHVGIATRTE